MKSFDQLRLDLALMILYDLYPTSHTVASTLTMLTQRLTMNTDRRIRTAVRPGDEVTHVVLHYDVFNISSMIIFCASFTH